VPLSPSPEGYGIAVAPPEDLPASVQLRKLRIELNRSFGERNYPFCEGDPTDIMAHANFAASIQAALEDVILRLATIARQKTGQPNLVLAGGVALNCTANGLLIRSGPFDEVWVPPFAYDAGGSIGAALVADRAIRGAEDTPPRMAHPFWAPDTGEPDGCDLDALSGCEVSRHDGRELADEVAKELAKGRVAGWWQGRAEVGQRALGARSILCDPRDRQQLIRTNLIKGREIWRPLAPAVLAEETGMLFDGTLPAAADFMLTAWPMREEAQPQVPVAVHVDGSARPQVVRPTQRPYHELIQAFHERTGVPAVINTSFNIAGEPIVYSTEDAVDTFLRSDLDVLVLGDIVARKPTTEDKPAG
jgi:carbamoyltransferase